MRWRRWVLKAIRIALVAIPLLTAAVLFPSIRLAALHLMGRAHQCSLRQAVDSFEVLKDRQVRARDIRAAARRLRSEGEFDYMHTRDGDYWVPQRNHETLYGNLAEQEQDVYGFEDGGVRKGGVVLDCGANVGVFTRKALLAGAGRVFAVEPAPENVACLRRNFADEIRTGKVTVLAVGVWNEAAELPLNIDAGSSARNSFVGTFGRVAGVVQVPLVTIDSIVDSLSLAQVEFIKLDIEGAEKRAITGATGVLRRFHPRLAIAMEHLEDDPDAIPALIRSMQLGYRIVCGPCIDVKTAVTPDVLYFIPN